MVRRWSLLTLLLLSLLWQAVLPARAASVPAPAHAAAGAALDHADLHHAGEPHHHHEDGSITLDDSAESRLHLQAESPVHAPALPAGERRWLARQPSAPPAEAAAVRPPSPPRDGPHKPPRSIA